jgi:hypothetical protein
LTAIGDGTFSAGFKERFLSTRNNKNSKQNFLWYCIFMFCQICQQRESHVTQTYIYVTSGQREVRHLCEVCAGLKTETQWDKEREEEKKRWAMESLQRREQSRQMSQLVNEELFKPRLSEIRSKQVRIHTRSLDPANKLMLFGISSPLPEVDPMEVLFGASETGKNHVVRMINDCAVHVFRWDENPNRLLTHIFEPFPDAGARLDLNRKLLFVESGHTLFEDSKKSLSFCNLSADQFNSSKPTELKRFRFRSKAFGESH